MQREYRNRRPRRVQAKREREERKPLIDMYNIFKFVVIWVILSAAAFGVKKVVMMALSMSPTGKVGNGMLTLYEVHNTGAAFNLFAGQQEMIITASFFAVAIIAFIMIMTSNKQSGTAVFQPSPTMFPFPAV